MDAEKPHASGIISMQNAIKTPTMVRHTVRTKMGGRKEIKYGRKGAIYLMCTQCLGWEEHPETCTDPLCPLYPFRGKTNASNR